MENVDITKFEKQLQAKLTNLILTRKFQPKPL